MKKENKKLLRKQILELRDSIDKDDRKQWDELIFLNIINSELYKRSSVIFTFVSFGNEVDTHRFIKYALKDKKTVCVPQIPSKEIGIEVYKINDFSELSKGYFGILEPSESAIKMDVREIDLILVPGIAFDKSGGRIGYGGGFYDRYFSELKSDIPKVAVAYSLQMLDEIPLDEHDIKVDGYVNEIEFRLFN